MALPTSGTSQDKLLSLNLSEGTPFTIAEGVSITPLFLDREQGVWVIYGRFAPGTTLPTHYHTGEVHFFTTKGAWNYAEYPEDVQMAGSYLFEPGGSSHTFTVSPDATEDAEGFMYVKGANINFLNGDYQDITDAASIEDGLTVLATMMNLPMPKYFRPGRGTTLSTAPDCQRVAVSGMPMNTGA